MASEDPLRVLIVDDEPLARRRLEQLLRPRADAEIVGQAGSGREAVETIRAEAPDLVFLDVQMPGLSGTGVIQEIGPEHMPTVVFVTAYDQYATEAFDLAALDYLVKPFDEERFADAFERARQQVRLQEKGQAADQLLAMLEHKDPPATDGDATGGQTNYLKRIAVETPGRVRVLPIREVDYITASGSYAELHVGDNSYPVRERMKTLERRLNPTDFVRIHRSTIVRIEQIDALLRSGGGQYAVELKDGTRLGLSRGRQEEVQERLGLEI